MTDMATKSRLEKLLGVTCSVVTYSETEWRTMQESADAMNGLALSIELEGKVYFRWHQKGGDVELLTVEADKLTGAERALIEWILQTSQLTNKEGNHKSGSSEEQRANQLGQWIHGKLGGQYTGVQDEELPDSIGLKSRLLPSMIPFLLVSEHPQLTHTTYTELYKLLKSYFGGEVYLIPLEEKEWLILCGEELLASAEDREEDGAEKPEEALALFCEGLYELLSNEWLGECHLAVSYPMVPAHTLLSTVGLLRETMYLGRAFHVTSNIHLPWMLHMERLINSIPDGMRRQFIDRVLSRSDVFLDPETLTTLEAFFSLDCNVSDTAKKLYIHRNTLLYRLDKIKQETGLDVRTFGDAVLVKLILLLYKVTKRK